MSDKLTIKTNNVPRYTVDGYELSPKERKDFDYYKPDDLDCATFFRYRGNVYDVAEFMRVDGIAEFKGWHGYSSDSYFSGILIKFPEDDQESVIVATYYS
jgi:hypothetical protein